MLCTLLLTALLSQSVQAQQADPPISTDSPSLTNSCDVVPTGRVQIESGLYYTSSQSAAGRNRPRGRSADPAQPSDDDIYSLPTLIRVGTGEDVELRISGELVQIQGSREGLSDGSLGFKWRFYNPEDGPSLALLGSLTIPSGSPAFRSPAAGENLELLAQFDLDESTNLVVNLGASLDGNGSTETPYLQGFLGACLSHSLSSDWSIYVEIASAGPDEPRVSSYETTVDSGLSYTVNRDWVLNLAVFKGLSAEGLNWGGYVGFGARF